MLFFSFLFFSFPLCLLLQRFFYDFLNFFFYFYFHSSFFILCCLFPNFLFLFSFFISFFLISFIASYSRSHVQFIINFKLLISCFSFNYISISISVSILFFIFSSTLFPSFIWFIFLYHLHSDCYHLSSHLLVTVFLLSFRLIFSIFYMFSVWLYSLSNSWLLFTLLPCLPFPFFHRSKTPLNENISC